MLIGMVLTMNGFSVTISSAKLSVADMTLYGKGSWEIVAGVIGSCAGVSALGPVPLGGGVVRTIRRFSYAQGAEVARELKAWRNKLASGPRKTAGERVKIVLDNPHSLDALTSE